MSPYGILLALAELPSWIQEDKNSVINLTTGIPVVLNQDTKTLHVQLPKRTLSLTTQPEQEHFLAVAEAQDMALYPKYWAVTLFWTPSQDHNGAKTEGGYSTHYLDRSPIDYLNHLHELGHTEAHIVFSTPITKAQYAAHPTKLKTQA